jgi:hypothetical protein
VDTAPPSEAEFWLFSQEDNNRELYRFGRKPERSPAPPWDRDHLN